MKEQLEILRKRFHQAKTDAEKDNIKTEMLTLLDENPDEFANSMLSIAKQIADETDEFLLKDKLKEVSKIVSISYIAKEYFGKSRSWLHQRINGNIVNGHPVTLSEDERKTLNFAFADITKKIGSMSIWYLFNLTPRPKLWAEFGVFYFLQPSAKSYFVKV